ncbi:neurocalcin-delta-like [Branchiostoma lanceolatum]|uniref:neurocalcin-delta-like n=1 Tax=Branchiostoma lanceolatum TaxID=7740 RepID=UPI003453DB07
MPPKAKRAAKKKAAQEATAKRVKKMAKGKIQQALMTLLAEEEEMKKAVNQAFKKLDTDGSGFLEKDEFYEALNDILGAAEDEKGIGKKAFDNFFEKLDEDEDGKISKEEFTKKAKRIFKKMHEEPDAAGDD